MTPSELLHEIHAVSGRLIQRGFVLQTNPVRCSQRGHVVELSSAYDTTIEGDLPPIPTPAQYLLHIRSRNYSLILKDGALIQVYYLFRYGGVVRHRLCYFPCPVNIASEDLGAFSLEELVEAYLHLDPVGNTQLMPIVRFDYDRGNAHQGHPEAHMHLACSSCRVPLHAPVGGRQFFHFILRHFYPEWYSEDQSFQGLGWAWLGSAASPHDGMYLHSRSAGTP